MKGYNVIAAMVMLYPLMEAIRSGGDLENLGGDGKYSKTIVCPDGCVMFCLTAKPLEGENFYKGVFWKELRRSLTDQRVLPIRNILILFIMVTMDI